VTIGDAIRWLALVHTFALYLFLPLVVALPLALMLKSRLVSIMALALTLAAGAWFIPPTLPKSIPPHEGATLKVVSFNIFGEGADRNLDAEVDWLLTTNADVIFLPEVMSQGVDPRLARLNAVYPFEYYTRWDKHLFSRYPFKTVDTVRLTNGYEPRRMIRAVIEFEGRDISLYAVHLPVPVSDDSGIDVTDTSRSRFAGLFITRYDETTRNRQIANLLSIIQDDPNPVIAAGDFNTNSTSPAYGRIAAVLKDTYAEAGYGLGHTWGYAPVLRLPAFIPPVLRVDYIWHSDDLMALSHEVAPGLGSDHLPIVATLAWR
jgi:vancomycin resistance protein VanJ